MVQILKSTSSWRSSDDLTDMDFTQAAELLGSNLDLSDEMSSLIGMDNLFDDVDEVITEDRDIFMGCTEDSQLKNDIFMNCDNDQEVLGYNDLSPDLSPEAVSYDDVTSPLHSSSDESQDRVSYSGGLTPDSDIMDSDIMEAEEPVCDESVIPLVALEMTGAYSPVKDIKRPIRRKNTTKVGGVRKRRQPVKGKPPKTVKGRVGRPPTRGKRVEPDVQCIKVCPPTSEKTTNFSPSTMFPTIMSALRTNPTNVVPLEKLVKPKGELVNNPNPDISCIHTPPTTPVELKPATMIGAQVQDVPAKNICENSSALVELADSLEESPSDVEYLLQTDTTVVKSIPEISPESITISDEIRTHSNEISSDLMDSEMEVVPSVSDNELVSVKSEPLQVDENQNEQNVLNQTEVSSPQNVENNSVRTRGKSLRVPSPTRMRTRGITHRRPSIPAKTKNEPRSPKAVQRLPPKEVKQTVIQVSHPPLPTQEVTPPPSAQCTSLSVSQCAVPVAPDATPPVQNRSMTVSTYNTPCPRVLSEVKPPSATVIATSAARLGQPSVTPPSAAKSEHLPRPAKITAVPLTAIPARSTILGILPSTTRIRSVTTQSSANISVQLQSAPIKLQHLAVPAQLQTTQAAALPGTTILRTKPQATVSVPPSTVSAVSTIPHPSPVVSSEVHTLVAPPAQPSATPPSPQVVHSPVPIKKEIDSDTNDTENNVASRNTEILHLLNKQTSLSCVKMEEDPLPRSYSGYSSSSSCSSGSPAPPHSPSYHTSQTPAVVSIKEEMLSDYSDEEDDYERFKNLSPDEQGRVRKRRYNNRVAAQRCRQRKRDHFQGLKKEIQEWECSNTQLKYEIHTLQKELKSLAKVWNDHATQCETAVALKMKKHKKHKKSHRAETATSSSGCNQNITAASSGVSDPSTAPVPIVVN